MSLVVHDYRCTKCPGYEADKLVSRKAMDDVRCPACDAPMVRLPPPTRTTFRFADRRLKS